MLNRDEFLARRKQGIGGSDIAAIINLSPWKSPRDVWFDKVGHDGEGNPLEPPEETPAMYWGQVHEATVANEYELRTSRKVEATDVLFTGEGKHGGKPYFIGNVDRLVRADNDIPAIDQETGKLNTDRILECKTSSQYAAGEWGEDGTDEIPEFYRAQVQWYMGVTGCKYADVAVLIGGNDFRMFTIERNDEVIAFLFGEAEKFWQEYVIPEIMPPARSLDDSVNAFRKGTEGESKYASDGVIEKCRAFAELQTRIKELEDEQSALKMAICEELGNAVELLDAGGKKLCSWSVSKPVKVIDYKGMFKYISPAKDVLERFTTEKPGARRFTIAKAKD